MKQFAIIAAVLLVLIGWPTRAGAAPLTFSFSFGSGTDELAGVFWGDYYDFKGAHSGFIPAESNWAITGFFFTSMPAHMRTVYIQAGPLQTDPLPDPVDFFRPSLGDMYYNYATVTNGVIVSGTLGLSSQCELDCTWFRMVYAQGGGGGTLWAAHADSHGIIDQETASGTFTLQAVPEPATLTLVALGLVGAGVRRRMLHAMQARSRNS